MENPCKDIPNSWSPFRHMYGRFRKTDDVDIDRVDPDFDNIKEDTREAIQGVGGYITDDE